MKPAITRPAEERVNWVTSIPMLASHLVPLLAFVTGVTWKSVILCVVLYVTRMFFITAGYHRYFAHRSFKTNRVFQFVLALGGATAAQKGPLWWAGHHRDHHRFSDTDRDLHSPLKGFWWSQLGWILCDKNNAIDAERQIKDFNSYPELRWLDRHFLVPPVLLAIGCFFIAGWPGVVIGFFLSTVLLWHGTFTVNSLAHVMGRRRYATSDTSRNSALIAIWTLGEGWHNNHHYYPASARQGFYWWEYDLTYWALRVLNLFGLVRDLKTPPNKIRVGARVRDGQLDIGMFTAHWQRATAALSNATTALSAALHDKLGSDPTPAPEPTPVTTAAAPAAVADIAPVAPATTLASAADVSEADQTRLNQLEASLRDHRAALEESIQSALRHAEELSKLTRRGQRDLGLVSADSS